MPPSQEFSRCCSPISRFPAMPPREPSRFAGGARRAPMAARRRCSPPRMASITRLDLFSIGRRKPCPPASRSSYHESMPLSPGLISAAARKSRCSMRGAPHVYRLAPSCVAAMHYAASKRPSRASPLAGLRATYEFDWRCGIPRPAPARSPVTWHQT